MLFIILVLIVDFSLFAFFCPRPLHLDELPDEYNYIEQEEYFFSYK